MEYQNVLLEIELITKERITIEVNKEVYDEHFKCWYDFKVIKIHDIVDIDDETTDLECWDEINTAHIIRIRKTFA